MAGKTAWRGSRRLHPYGPRAMEFSFGRPRTHLARPLL